MQGAQFPLLLPFIVAYPNLESGIGTTGTYYTGSSGKCGGYSLHGVDYLAAIPLAYWPPSQTGNCQQCNITCGSGFVTYKNQALCYRVTSYSTKNTKVIGVVESCGGNCAPCMGASPDCASLGARGYEDSVRCPIGQFCAGLTDSSENINPNAQGHNPIYPNACNQPPHPVVSYPGYVDWCNGKYLHFDINGRQPTELCSTNDAGGTGVCAIKYERISCP